VSDPGLAAAAPSERSANSLLTFRLPTAWEHAQLDSEHIGETIARLATSLEGVVDRPAEVAAEAVPAFAKRMAAGSAPVLAAWFSATDEDGLVLAANLVVVRSEIASDLERLESYFDGSERVSLPIGEVLRVASMNVVDTAEVAGKVPMATWEYIVPMDPSSVLIASFSTPDVAVADAMGDWFEQIMSTAQWSDAA
jgi:hypothetical protein